MRKIFSLMTAILFAGSMMATDYQKVTSTDQLVAGAKYVIGTDDGSFIATTSNNNNRKITTAEVTDGVVTATDAMMVFELGGEAGAWTFATVNYLGTAGYLNTTSTTGSNYLKIVAELDEYAYFAIAIEEGVTTVTCTGKDSRNILYQNGTTCFSCYNAQTSSQYHKPNLYKEIGGGVEPQPQPLADGFYLVGTMNAWTPAAAYKFEANPANENEMMLAGVNLAENAELKVRQVAGGEATAWFPDGENNNYVVDAAHAGEKDIYFRADGQGGEGWHYGYIYIAENVVPVADFTQPFTLKFNGTGNSGSDASTAFAADVAAIFDAASAPYVAEVTEATKVYAGRPIADDNSSVKFGTSSAQGTLAFTLAQAIEVDSIVVNATQYGNNASKITVNGTEFDLNAGNKVPQNVKITPAGEISAITIAQSASERMYLRYIAVYPKQGGGVEPQPQPLADGFYLVGTMNDWTPAAEYKFAVNPDNEAEMVLAGVTLAENAELKVRQVAGGEATLWFPAEAGNYVVDADHAGEKDIYFRADYQGGEGWYAGCIYIAANEPEPQPGEGGVIYDWAGAVGTTIFGPAGVETSTVKIHTNTDQVDAIKFGSSYVYADGKYIAIKPAKGGFLAGDVLSVAVVFSNSSDAKYAQVDLRAADGDTRIWLSDSASTINARTQAGDPIVQTYTLTADQDSLLLGRYGNTSMFITLLKVERGVEPQPQPLADGFYLVGTMNDWTPAAEYKFAVNPDNEAEMVLAGVNLAENAELKVRQVENGVATAWFPAEAGNYVVDAAHAGLKDIYFRADYAGDQNYWYAGCIYIAANNGSAIINTEAAKVAVKQLRNGMVIIRRGDREYTIMGQLVK